MNVTVIRFVVLTLVLLVTANCQGRRGQYETEPRQAVCFTVESADNFSTELFDFLRNNSMGASRHVNPSGTHNINVINAWNDNMFVTAVNGLYEHEMTIYFYLKNNQEYQYEIDVMNSSIRDHMMDLGYDLCQNADPT